jgi:subtilisin family serine protease
LSFYCTLSVLGTVGGTKYGIAKNANLIAVKVLNSQGSGSWAGIIAGIDWVVAQANLTGSNRAVINMSLGGGFTSALNDAVNNAVAVGVVVAVAGGNENQDACRVSPASAANAITVGATATNDARASYSNFGSCIDIFAPGSNIISARTNTIAGNLSLSGTSMASPHVAGVAALLLQEDPTITPALLAQKILADATSGVVVGAGSQSPNLMLYTGAITVPVTTPISAPSPVLVPAPIAPSPSCAAKFAFCTTNSDCCSNSCKGTNGNRRCR